MASFLGVCPVDFGMVGNALFGANGSGTAPFALSVTGGYLKTGSRSSSPGPAGTRGCAAYVPTYYAANFWQMANNLWNDTADPPPNGLPVGGALDNITVKFTAHYDLIAGSDGAHFFWLMPSYDFDFLDTTQWQVHLDMNTAKEVVITKARLDDSSPVTILNTGYVLTENVDYDFEISIYCGSGTADAWGLKINGALVGSGTTKIGETGAKIKSFGFGPNYGGAWQNLDDIDWYFKDISLFRDGFPGTGEIVRLSVDGAGTYSTMTGAYTDIDDAAGAIDDDTTYILGDANGERSTFTLDTSPLPADVEIGGVQILGIGRFPTGSSLGGASLVAGGTLYDTVTTAHYFNTTVYQPTALWVLQENPDTSDPWTLSDLSTLEIGAKLLTGGATYRITVLYAFVWVEYPPQEIDLAPVEMSLTGVAPAQTWLGYGLEPVVMHLGVNPPTLTQRTLSLNPVVMRLRDPGQGVGITRYVVPTARGRWWTVSTTQPIIAEEGYIWVDPTIPATPRIYQYVNGAWVDAVVGLEEAATRVSWDGGGSSASANLATIANLTGLNIPADEHIMIEATFANTGGVDATALGIEINNITVMSGVAAPGTTTGEYGIWRIIIPRRDVAASLQGRSYILVPGQAQVVTTLASVPINTPITSIELLADPNSTVNFEIRNVVVNSLQT
jgi:hypothetical protein